MRILVHGAKVKRSHDLLFSNRRHPTKLGLSLPTAAPPQLSRSGQAARIQNRALSVFLMLSYVIIVFYF